VIKFAGVPRYRESERGLAWALGLGCGWCRRSHDGGWPDSADRARQVQPAALRLVT
jgi:hypothetical protein